MSSEMIVDHLNLKEYLYGEEEEQDLDVLPYEKQVSPMAQTTNNLQFPLSRPAEIKNLINNMSRPNYLVKSVLNYQEKPQGPPI